jgi:3'-phosphoadenosine 5'-phosphosulfate sulfotransferase (PAPS reductase)/FAD synthetase
VTKTLLKRVEAHVREHDLIAKGEHVTCLVSGGADSTCLWHALRELGYPVRAVHIHHGLRGGDADLDAEHCAATMGADIRYVHPRRGDEDELRTLRYEATAADGLLSPDLERLDARYPRATGRRRGEAVARPDP